MSNGGCGGTHLAAPGWYTFRSYNAAAEGGEVDLINPADGAIYAEVGGLGPGTSSPMRLDVGSGSYAFRCLFDDYDPMTGPTVVVGGHASGTRAILPITSNDLLAPAKEYHSYVTAGLSTLASQVGALTADLGSGSIGAAKAAWLPAHLTYERLGAASGSFGDFDREINGRPDGLVGGAGSPQLTASTGWNTGYGPGRAQPSSPGSRTAWPLTWGRCATSWPEHRNQLARYRAAGSRDSGKRTGIPAHRPRRLRRRDHAGHHTGQHHRRAELPSILHPLLVPRYPALPAVYTGWTASTRCSRRPRRTGSGRRCPSSRESSREQSIRPAAALEELAPIAAITEPRIT